MKIYLKELIGSSLNSVFAVNQLFEEISKTEDSEVILDFTGVQFITVSFAQAYVAYKGQSDKNIKEINLSEENKITLKVVSQKKSN